MAKGKKPAKGGKGRSQVIIASKPGAKGQTGSEDRMIGKLGGGKLMNRGIKR